MSPTARRLIIVEDRPASGVRSRLSRLVPGARSRRQLIEARHEVDRLRRRVDKLELREDLGYLFVVTYGRSGSTLLQGILDSIPGYLIRGENRQVLMHVYKFHRAAVKQRALHRRGQRKRDEPVGGLTSTKAWYGMDNFGVRASLRDARRPALDTLLRPEPDTRVTGFKEIRWAGKDVPDYVDWLRRVFPGARFVVNTRDLAAVSKSKWWADRPDAYDQLREGEQRLLHLAEELGDAAFHVHYDDYVDDPRALKPLFDWLGEEFDEARIRAVMDVPHSY
jgi:Sulfotransferase family